MKKIGTKQFRQKVYKLLAFEGRWKDTFGDIPKFFMMVIFGKSGNGKTEFIVQLVAYLMHFGKVSWWSYEQGHGPDLQRAIERNIPETMDDRIQWVDPIEKQNRGFFEELKTEIGKRKSADFFVIDSVDYTEFGFEQYKELKRLYGKKKGIIWVSHELAGEPKSSLAKKIGYDGGFTLHVKKFIAWVEKNRYGGTTPFVIWEEEARKRNPEFFAPKEDAKPKKQRKPRAKKIKQVSTKKVADNNDVDNLGEELPMKTQEALWAQNAKKNNTQLIKTIG